MARLIIDHDNDRTITLSQCGQHIVLSADQVESVIKNLELATLEMRQTNFERQKREDQRRIQAWDSERRSFNAVYVEHKANSQGILDCSEPVDTSQVVD